MSSPLQIPMTFPDYNGGSFHNSVGLGGKELNEANTRAENLEVRLLELVFKRHPDRSFTVYELLEFCDKHQISYSKESSLRRALSNLSMLDKYKQNGVPALRVTGKRLNPKYSPIANNTYQLNN